MRLCTCISSHIGHGSHHFLVFTSTRLEAQKGATALSFPTPKGAAKWCGGSRTTQRACPQLKRVASRWKLKGFTGNDFYSWWMSSCCKLNRNAYDIYISPSWDNKNPMAYHLWKFRSCIIQSQFTFRQPIVLSWWIMINPHPQHSVGTQTQKQLKNIIN